MVSIRKTSQRGVSVYVARGLTSPSGRFQFLGRGGKPFLLSKIDKFLTKNKKGSVELYKIESSFFYKK